MGKHSHSPLLSGNRATALPRHGASGRLNQTDCPASPHHFPTNQAVRRVSHDAK